MRLRPDIIKLDRALTTGVDADSAKAALIASFVRYARDIDATICAEGIETRGELERLADLDVAYGQGYLIARPAAPWPPVAPDAERSCLETFRASLDEAADGHEHDSLEAILRRLADVATPEDLEDCLPAIARELHAYEVRVSADTTQAVHLVAESVGADADAVGALHAQGYRSSLSLPLVHRGATLASLRAYRRTERPWSRFEVRRARLISHQLAAVLERIGTAPLSLAA
jgi:GAF domain-containing protein